MKLAAILALALTACAAQPPIAKGVKWVRDTSACKPGTGACVFFTDNGCEIHSPEIPREARVGYYNPEATRELALLGHELLHCFEPEFHCLVALASGGCLVESTAVRS